MNSIIQSRLHNQRLTGARPETPEEAVHLLGAVQSQDFAPAKWSVGQRTMGATDARVHEAYVAGTILRTHVLRPTWHFVLPADIRWMLELMALRGHAASNSFYRSQGLDTQVLTECRRSIEVALQNGHHLTRKEIGLLLEGAGIPTTPMRLSAIMLNLELEAVVCSGVPRGKQHTYALFEERVPRGRRLSREQALAELTLRYFTGHGPATLKDFKWWSSLTITDIRCGLDLCGPGINHEDIDGTTYWFAADWLDVPARPRVHLLQGYDEYIVGYGESKHLFDVSGLARLLPRPRGVYTNAVVLDGQVAGQWKPIVWTNSLAVEVQLFEAVDDSEGGELASAIERYGTFLNLPLHLTVPGGTSSISATFSPTGRSW
jgi:hypothetical protein